MTSKPSIIVSSLDLQRLQALLDSLPMTALPGKADLQAERDRAEVVEPKDVPVPIQGHGST
jgi:regulator of nucleoside diphosphate kinase